MSAEWRRLLAPTLLPAERRYSATSISHSHQAQPE